LRALRGTHERKSALFHIKEGLIAKAPSYTVNATKDCRMKAFDQSIISKRWGVDAPPTILADIKSGSPISMCHLRGATPRSEVIVIPEPAFVFLVPLDVVATSSKTGGQRQIVDVSATPGDAYLLDLSKSSKNAINTPFNLMRLYISTRRLTESAYEKELPLVHGLSLSTLSSSDPVLYQLAQTMACVVDRGPLAPTLLTDYLALAFHVHVARTYGGAKSDRLTVKGGLSPWQLRRVYEFIEERPTPNPSIAELAQECGISESHFARAFRRTVGMAPHEWLIKRRIAKAKELMIANDMSLAEVALACSFVDQSHFTSVFSRHEGKCPGIWRRHSLFS
jgi:AraC family transcriptional regulator